MDVVTPRSLVIWLYLFSFILCSGVATLIFGVTVPSLLVTVIAAACLTTAAFYLIRCVEKLRPRDVMAESAKIQAIFDEDCDPIRYIKEMTALLDRPIKNKDHHMAFVTNLALGYIHNGQANQGIRLVEDLLKHHDKYQYDVLTSASVNLVLCLGYLSIGNLNAAEKHYQKMGLDCDRAKSDKLEDAAINIEAFLRTLDARFSFEEGRYEEALRYFESLFNELLDEPSYRLSTALGRFRLALIYEKLGNSAKEKEHLEYVAEYGNLLHVARLAREKLETAQPPEIVQDSTAASCEK